MDNECPLCLNPARKTRIGTASYVSCKVCGEYIISYAIETCRELRQCKKRYILSAVARNRHEQGKKKLEILTLEDMKTIIDSVSEPSASDAIDLLLKYLRKEQPDKNEYVPLDAHTNYPILYAKNPADFQYLVEQACDIKKYIERDSPVQQPVYDYRLSLKGWDRLDEIDKPAKQEPDVEISPEMLGETERILDGIRRRIEASSLEDVFKEIALYDLEQAKLAYKPGASKACIVMLGAVLEGLMLGTIFRPEALERIKADPPKVVKKLGLNDPQLTDKIAEELGFEDYKNIIHHLMPDIEKLKAEGIQVFRNTIHPWNTVKEPAIYKDPGRTRAMLHLTSLEILAQHILSWTP